MVEKIMGVELCCPSIFYSRLHEFRSQILSVSDVVGHFLSVEAGLVDLFDVRKRSLAERTRIWG